MRKTTTKKVNYKTVDGRKIFGGLFQLSRGCQAKIRKLLRHCDGVGKVHKKQKVAKRLRSKRVIWLSKTDKSVGSFDRVRTTKTPTDF